MRPPLNPLVSTVTYSVKVSCLVIRENGSTANMPTKFKLNTGAEIPGIGFGTWQDEAAQEDAVTEALKVGYRHIDTARM